VHWSWGHFAQFWQTPAGVLYFLVLPVVLLLVTTVIYLAEKKLPKRPSQIFILSLAAYDAAWLVQVIQWSSWSLFPQLPGLAVVLVFISTVFIAPLITYLAVLITFECSPQEALRLWGRWILPIAILLFVFAGIGYGVAFS
jgi:hypothetical protein